MSMVQPLSILREPPVPGRFYLVPFVRFVWHNVEADWPVFGPMHSDADFFKFPKRHYHVDARFVSARLIRRIASDDIEGDVQRYPLAQRWGDDEPDLPNGRPALGRFRCRTADFPYRMGHQPAVLSLRDCLGEPKAIALADGRKLCPHRKVDLSTLIPDEDGLVTCPLHGLRVDCRQ